jgi:hypothetical protein
MEDNNNLGAVYIAMWSGPRNISTALMRSFENRPDTLVIDEPFYAHYLHQTGLEHPGRETVLAAQSINADDVIKDITAPIPNGKSVFYQKHMTQHMLDTIDPDWMSGMQHAFLIRDPAFMLASYVKQRSEVNLSDIGIVQQKNLFDKVCDATGNIPPVIDSADVLKDPEGILAKLCEAFGIVFTDQMLSWPEGKRESDGAWAPWWYANVETSTGFAPYQEKEIALDAYLQSIADEAQPYYDYMSKHKLQI